MEIQKLFTEYYNHLLQLVEINQNQEYSKLLRHLHNTDFSWVIPNDANRADDGKSLRMDFLQITAFEQSDIFIQKECSIMEMLIAMSVRITNDIMPDSSNTASDWFWIFIDNLGLSNYRNSNYDAEIVSDILHRFVTRCGKMRYGVLFFSEKVTQKKWDSLEFWYQMHVWLDENYEF